MSENVKVRQHMERRIVRRIILDGKRAGYTFNIDNGGDGLELLEPTDNVRVLLDTMFAVDEEHLIFYRDGRRAVYGWVYFIYGNGNSGLDVVSDYTTNLKDVMQGAEALVSKYDH